MLPIIESSYEVVERLSRYNWVGRAYTHPGFFVWHLSPPDQTDESCMISEDLLTWMYYARTLVPVFSNLDFDEGELGESGELIGYELNRDKDKRRDNTEPTPDPGVELDQELLCG